MIRKIIGSGLIYAAFGGWTITVCFADGMRAMPLFGAIAACGIAALAGVALRGADNG